DDSKIHSYVSFALARAYPAEHAPADAAAADLALLLAKVGDLADEQVFEPFEIALGHRGRFVAVARLAEIDFADQITQRFALDDSVLIGLHQLGCEQVREPVADGRVVIVGWVLKRFDTDDWFAAFL